MVREEKKHELKKRMEDLGIQEDHLEEKFILGSGSGGQHLQKTSSTVYLKHIPTGTEVKCQKTRSRELNRFFARRLLCELLSSEKQLKIDKIRKQKDRRKRRRTD